MASKSGISLQIIQTRRSASQGEFSLGGKIETNRTAGKKNFVDVTVSIFSFAAENPVEFKSLIFRHLVNNCFQKQFFRQKNVLLQKISEFFSVQQCNPDKIDVYVTEITLSGSFA